MTEARKPIDAALDLLVYVPVGLAVTAAEELPKLAAKGRSRVTTQLTMARVVGQFALSRGRSLIEQRIEQVASAPPRSAAPGHPNGGSADDSDMAGAADGVPLTYDDLIGSQPASRSSRGMPENPPRQIYSRIRMTRQRCNGRLGDYECATG